MNIEHEHSKIRVGKRRETYTYERQDIIQIALKRLPGGRERRKKKFVR
jgi:hypothetical protein